METLNTFNIHYKKSGVLALDICMYGCKDGCCNYYSIYLQSNQQCINYLLIAIYVYKSVVKMN